MKKQSHLERALATQLRMLGLPTPQPEYKAIPGRRFRWDFAWPKQKLLVEVQGGIFRKGGHSTGKGITRDCEKLNLATLNGWHCINVTAAQIRTGDAALWIKEALGSHS